MKWIENILCNKYFGFFITLISVVIPFVSLKITKDLNLSLTQFVIGILLAIQSFMASMNSEKKLSKVNNRIDELGFHFIESPEYLYAITDAEDKLLFCVRTDGTIDWALGIPHPIKKELERLEMKIEERRRY